MRQVCFRSSSIVAVLMVSLVHLGSINVAGAQSRPSALKAGAGLTTFAGSADFRPLPNLAASLSLRQPLGPIYLQPEAQISSRSARLSNPPIDGPIEGNVTRQETGLTYVDVPLLIGLQLPSPLGPFAHVGPYGGIRANARTSVTIDETRTFSQEAEDVHRFDYGAMAGVGAHINTRFYRLVVELRGMMGFAPIFDDGPDHTHRALLLMAGITL